MTATAAPTPTVAPSTVRSRGARVAVLFTSLVCAACGLVYELALLALGSYLIGDTVRQASIVLGVFVCAMGLGALAAKRLQQWPVASFAVIEALLGLLGGLSVLGLYSAFAWLDLYQPALIFTSVVLGALIGAEIPVLVALLQRLRADDTVGTVADLFAADYVGSLVGGLAFPFVLLPVFGQLKGALVVGAVNVIAAGGLVLVVFGKGLRRAVRLRLAAALLAVLAVLGFAAVSADRFEITARQALYDDPIVSSQRSPYQEIVLTRSRSGRDLRLFLNGDLQFSSVDEYRYHEALVHPAMNGAHRRVLVLGGGDGLALREVVRYGGVESVVLVELDPAVVELARTNAALQRLNERSLSDVRVDVVTADAFTWLRTAPGRFDVVITDFPDPENVATAKLYSVEFFGLVAKVLAPDGRLVVQAGSPFFAPDAFWSIEATIAAAGFGVVPYHVDVPSFGDWGFVLARPEGHTPALRLPGPTTRPHLRSLDDDTLRAAQVFSPDRDRRPVRASTLLDPVIVEYEQRGWRDY